MNRAIYCNTHKRDSEIKDFKKANFKFEFYFVNNDVSNVTRLPQHLIDFSFIEPKLSSGLETFELSIKESRLKFIFQDHPIL